MKKRTRPLLAWIGIFVAAGGVFLFSRTVMVLSVSNLDHPSCSLAFRLAPSEPFAMLYTHSIYDAPVAEIFEAHSGEILLKSVRTDSPAVVEYYGFEGSAPLQDLNLNLGPTVTVQVGMTQEQRLAIGGKTIDLRTLADPGDRIRLNLKDVSLPSYLLWSLVGQGPLPAPVNDSRQEKRAP